MTNANTQMTVETAAEETVDDIAKAFIAELAVDMALAEDQFTSAHEHGKKAGKVKAAGVENIIRVCQKAELNGIKAETVFLTHYENKGYAREERLVSPTTGAEHTTRIKGKPSPIMPQRSKIEAVQAAGVSLDSFRPILKTDKAGKPVFEKDDDGNDTNKQAVKKNMFSQIAEEYTRLNTSDVEVDFADLKRELTEHFKTLESDGEKADFVSVMARAFESAK